MVLINIFKISNSYIKGIRQDYEVVKKSLIYEQSNGVVEASVNKIKLNKRIIYGRCGFELLKAKNTSTTNFSLFQLTLEKLFLY